MRASLKRKEITPAQRRDFNALDRARMLPDDSQSRMVLFPTWAAQKVNPVSEAKKDILYSLNQTVGDQTNPIFSALAKWRPTYAKFDTTTNRFEGTKIKELEDKTMKIKIAQAKRLDKSTKIIGNSITKQQMMLQLPGFMQQLLDDNANLSKAGMGAIKKNGLALYLGRWLDTSTGRVRLLPNATMKYVNPKSIQQKKNYLQAKMINRWNQLVQLYDSYDKLKDKDQTQYQRSFQNKIASLLDQKLGLIAYSNYITNKIVNTQININLKVPPDSYTQLLLQYAVENLNLDSVMSFSQNVLAPKTSEMKNYPDSVYTDIRKRAKQWEVVITDAKDAEISKILSQMQPSPTRVDLLAKIDIAAYGLMGVNGKRQKRGLMQYLKGQMLPINQRIGTASKMIETYDQVKQSMTKKLKTVTQVALPSSIAQVGDITKQMLKQTDFIGTAYGPVYTPAQSNLRFKRYKQIMADKKNVPLRSFYEAGEYYQKQADYKDALKKYTDMQTNIAPKVRGYDNYANLIKFGLEKNLSQPQIQRLLAEGIQNRRVNGNGGIQNDVVNMQNSLFQIPTTLLPTSSMTKPINPGDNMEVQKPNINKIPQLSQKEKRNLLRQAERKKAAATPGNIARSVTPMQLREKSIKKDYKTSYISKPSNKADAFKKKKGGVKGFDSNKEKDQYYQNLQGMNAIFQQQQSAFKEIEHNPVIFTTPTGREINMQFPDIPVAVTKQQARNQYDRIRLQKPNTKDLQLFNSMANFTRFYNQVDAKYNDLVDTPQKKRDFRDGLMRSFQGLGVEQQKYMLSQVPYFMQFLLYNNVIDSRDGIFNLFSNGNPNDSNQLVLQNSVGALLDPFSESVLYYPQTAADIKKRQQQQQKYGGGGNGNRFSRKDIPRQNMRGNSLMTRK